ncbi:sugar-specific transcriptional regulator TrmB [Planomicrobium koreense]|uniref:Sugar-specific transcriptional regulator TrmB n=1 Tax=Planococcus koreensis TaxID=112331 RepID=A0A7W8CU16_9BACL|nr:sugar-specific transcriptional regulator TrmB [Planococcus koreensis]
MALQIGIQFGRPTVYVSVEFKEVYRKWKARELTAVEAMQKAGVKKTSFYKLVKALEEETANTI